MSSPSPSPSSNRDELHLRLERLAARRGWLAAILTALMTTIYFGFMLLVAYRKEWLGGRLHEGLSRGILLGALVIVAAWALTFVYVRWANGVYDPAIRAIKDELARADADGD